MNRGSFFLALVVGLGLVGCKMKPSLPGILSATEPSNAYEDTSAWDEHTVGMPFTFGYNAGIAKAKAENKPAMIFLTTTWCTWCKRLSQDCLSDPEIQSTLQERFVLVLVDGDTEVDVKRQLKSSGYPFIAFVSPDEEILAVQNGYAKPEAFQGVISLALQKIAQR